MAVRCVCARKGAPQRSNQWLAQLWPDAGLIFATAEPARLARLLALLDRVEPQLEAGA